MHLLLCYKKKSFLSFVLKNFPLQTFLDSASLLRGIIYMLIIVFSHNESSSYDECSPHFLSVGNSSLAAAFPFAPLLFCPPTETGAE